MPKSPSYNCKIFLQIFESIPGLEGHCFTVLVLPNSRFARISHSSSFPRRKANPPCNFDSSQMIGFCNPSHFEKSSLQSQSYYCPVLLLDSLTTGQSYYWTVLLLAILTTGHSHYWPVLLLASLTIGQSY